MSAPLLEIDAEHPHPRHIQRAVDLLARGELVAYPTDTYYALGCALNVRKGVDRLYQLKGRDRRKPLSFIVPDLADVAQYALVSNFAYRTMKQLTPGPFTFVLPATRLVPDRMATKQKQVGIRIPDAPIPLALSRGLEGPLVTTSATGLDGEPLIDPREVKAQLGHGLALMLDGGLVPCEPSTVVSLIDDEIEILRQGQGIIEGF